MVDNRSIVVEDEVLPVGTLAVRIRVSVRRCLSGVGVLLILQNSIFSSVGYITMSPRTLPTIREVVVNLCLAGFTFLSSNKYNTVGSTCTVDSALSGILQYLNALNISWVDVVETTFDRHTIDNVQRVGVIDSTSTTNTYAGCCTWLT